MKKLVSLVILVALIVPLTGCFGVIVKRPVETNEMALIFRDGVQITQVVGPGRYGNGAVHAQMQKIDCSAKTIEWEDPDLWTKDKQPLAFKVGITYQRTTDPDGLRKLWTTYNHEAREDAALERLVRNRVPRVAKDVTTQFTLDEMLGIAEGGGREVLAQRMFALLEEELAEFGVVLLDVGANDIGADPQYKEKLQQKAAAKVESELAQERTRQLAEQVKQEQAQTEVALEIARRENAVAEEKAQVYEMSERAYELERIRLTAQMFGSRDKVWIVDPSSDVTFLFGSGSVIPAKE